MNPVVPRGELVPLIARQASAPGAQGADSRYRGVHKRQLFPSLSGLDLGQGVVATAA